MSVPFIKYLPSHLCVLNCFSHVQVFATLRTVPCQAPLSMGFSRQEYCSGLPCPPPGDLLDPGIKPMSLVSPTLAGGFFTTSATWEAQSTGDQFHSVAQSCPTLCDPMDYSSPSSSVHGILQARVLEWVAIPFSRGSSQPRDQTQVSCIAGRHFNL